jgi:photosystem II stability/assembly factor-like uncharacterized protein
MKTKSDFLFHVLYRRVLFILLCRTKYLAAVSLMLAGVLLTCYSAVANARRGVSNEVSVSPAEEDRDPEYLEKRREFLERFFGTGPEGVSPSAYASALAAARALPPSPLLQGRRFMSPETLETVSPWTLPIAPPIRNSYGGNASARVHALAIDPTNANVVYTGSCGGLAKTTDGGVTWRYLSDTWTSQSVSSIAISNNRNIVYVGTGNDSYGPYGTGLYRSLDGGAHWSNLGATEFGGTAIRAIAFGRLSRSGWTVYVANGLSYDSGFWRSSDSGVTWTRLRKAGQPGSNEEYNGIYDVAVDSSTSPFTLYITEDDGMFRSTDAGQSWTLIHTVVAGSRSRLSVVNSTLYLLVRNDPDHNLFKSYDRGATWIQIPTHCFAGADICANANNIGFSVFAVNPTNPQIILGGNQALYRTDNEGATWTEIGHWYGDPDPTRSIHTDQRVIAFSSIAPGVVYEGNDGGIVRSTNAGQQWTNLNQNFPGALLYGVALSQDGTMIAGTQDNGVVFSDPHASGGSAWDMIYGGDSAHNLIDPVDGAVGYFTMYLSGTFRRFNRATPHSTPDDIRPSQFDRDASCNFFPVFSMNPLYPKHLIAACQQVVRTLDGPTVTTEGWTTIGQSLADPNGNYVTAAYQAPNNSNVIYAVRGRNTVFVTSNADQGNSATWIQVTQANQIEAINAVIVDPNNPATAYLACNSGVYKTTNMGATWTQYGIPDLIYRDVAIDPANPQHIFAASNAGVYASTDGGLTWGNLSNGIPVGMAVTALSFNAMSRQLAASTYGRGVYILNLATTSAL